MTAGVLAVVLLLSSQPSVAQRRRAPRREGSGERVLVSAKKPGVFLTFLRAGEAEPLRAGEGGSHLWFRLTNNTRWPLWVKMSGATEGHGDAHLFYTVEDEENGRILINMSCHVCSINPLDPGRSITFTIPADYLSRGARLRMEYIFSWERDNQTIAGSYSKHSVEYDFYYLPTSVFPQQ